MEQVDPVEEVLDQMSADCPCGHGIYHHGFSGCLAHVKGSFCTCKRPTNGYKIENPHWVEYK